MHLHDTPSLEEKLLRVMLDQMDAVRGLNERLANQERQVEELIRKEGEVMTEMRNVIEKLIVPAEKMEGLQQNLVEHSKLFEKPLDKTVHYHHFIGRSIWVLGVMLVVTLASLAMTVWQLQRADQYSVDEIRWRFVKLYSDSVVAAVAHRAEQRGLEDPVQFARDVQQEEDRREELTKSMLREQEARRRIEELQRRSSLK